MVKEINSYVEKEQNKKKENIILNSWFETASEFFDEGLYRIEDHSSAITPFYDIHFKFPNKYFYKFQKIEEKTRMENIFIDRHNILNGSNSAARLHPLDFSSSGGRIETNCPEIHLDIIKYAEKLEDKLDMEITVETTYPKTKLY